MKSEHIGGNLLLAKSSRREKEASEDDDGVLDKLSLEL
nr:hypothetical protein [Tanacetum cinerariifolium]